MSKHDDGFIAYCYISQLRPTFGFGGKGYMGFSDHSPDFSLGERKKSMVPLFFATLIFDEFLACLNLSGVTVGKEPAPR
ncbi:hypothetical protein J8V57_18320 [Xenorhabdus sp. PB61.4]|uniref:hypothetical protein n=1 Tax=Xenorhabdus sp. PB61.4 TaxID=2788940 RepID=UPI001E58C360|nr:hypothetical protein [Xenorhabdus sp. PB61.4]MCC8368172.1 hypothetical protein [Xenorhabdus sp. PB61.4]